MDRQPINGPEMFKFFPAEVAEMECIIQKNDGALPPRSVHEVLAEVFTASRAREGRMGVLPKQVKNWFHNRKYHRKRTIAHMGSSQPAGTVMPLSGDKRHAPGSSLTAQPSSDLHASSSSGGQFVGEMVPECIDVQRRCTPFQPKECVDEGPEQSLHFDGRVHAIQRTIPDSSACHCKFLVRHEHDKNEVIVPFANLHRPPVSQASRVAASADCHIQPTKAIADVQPTKATVDFPSNEDIIREEPTKTIADLTSTENNTRAEKEPKKCMLMGVNICEVMTVSHSEQKKTANNEVGAIPATSPETCNVLASDEAIRNAKANPIVIEIDDD